MDSDSDASSSSSNVMCPPNAKRRRQEFQDSWLSEDEFKTWLEKCENNIYKAQCKICKKTLAAGRTNLLKHKASSQHHVNWEHASGDVTMNLTELVKSAEIRFCLDAIEHNRSFHSYEHFVEMLVRALPDSDIVKHISLKRTKMCAVIKNVIAKSILLKQTKLLRNKFFSVLLDESTDISDNKHLCILVRYVDKGFIHTSLLEYVRVKDCTAENLFKCLLYSLEKHQLSIENVVGLCADNANVMLEKHNSVTSRLIEKNKEVSVFPCICHSIHLMAHEASKCLPRYIEDFLHKIYSYFSRSPKRQALLEDTQQLMNLAQKKLVQPSPTRWLALAECVKVILAQWNPLFAVFAEATSGAESSVASDIFNALNSKLTKAYLQFLHNMLSVTARFNLLFQSNHVRIHFLLLECTRYLRYVANTFIKPEIIENAVLHEIDIYNEDNLLPIDELIIDSETRIIINDIKETGTSDDIDQIKDFYVNIKKFYLTLFQDAVSRLPFKETFLQSLDFLDPTVTLYIGKHKTQLEHIICKFPSKFDRQLVNAEWQDLPAYFNSEEKQELIKLNIPDFWLRISEIKHFTGTFMFSNISKVAELCLSLPHSNADVEQFFSIVTDVKTKKRNRLSTSMIKALSTTKLCLKNECKTCVTFDISSEMLDSYNQIYETEPVPQHMAGIILPDESDRSDVSDQSDYE